MDGVALREKGNTAFKAGAFAVAIEAYGEALSLEDSAALRSNRSAAYLATGAHEAALADADAALLLQPGWSKAHWRRGAALEALGKADEAGAEFLKGAEAAPADSAERAACVASARAAYVRDLRGLKELHKSAPAQPRVMRMPSKPELLRALQIATAAGDLAATAAAHAQLANLAMCDQDFGSAKRSAAAALALLSCPPLAADSSQQRSPTAGLTHLVLGATAFCSGRPDPAAAASLRLACAIARRGSPASQLPYSLSDALMYLGQCLSAISCEEEGEVALREALVLSGQGRDGAVVLGALTQNLRAQGLPLKALVTCEAALGAIERDLSMPADQMHPNARNAAVPLLSLEANIKEAASGEWDKEQAHSPGVCDRNGAALARTRLLRLQGLAAPTACATCSTAIAVTKPTPLESPPLAIEQCGHVFHKACLSRAGRGMGCPSCGEGLTVNLDSSIVPVSSGDGRSVTRSSAPPAPPPAVAAASYVLRAAPKSADELPIKGLPSAGGPCASLPCGLFAVAELPDEDGMPHAPRPGTWPPLGLFRATERGLEALARLEAPSGWQSGWGTPATAGPGGAQASGAHAALGDSTVLMFGGDEQSSHLWAVAGVPDRPRVLRVAARPDPRAGMPPGRCCCAAVVHDGRFFVLGGFSIPHRRPSDEDVFPTGVWDCWCYAPDDPENPSAGGCWQAIPLRGAAPPGGLWSHSAVRLPGRGGELLVFGGCSNIQFGIGERSRYSSSVFKARLPGRDAAPGPLAVELLATQGVPPAPRLGAAMVASPDGKFVLMLGGGAGQYTPKRGHLAHVFHCESHHWSAAKLQSETVHRCEGRAIDNIEILRETMLYALLPAPTSDADAPAASPAPRVVRACALPSCGRVVPQPRLFKACSRCTKVHYCSPEHHKEDWKRHKRDCAPADLGLRDSSNEDAAAASSPGDQKRPPAPSHAAESFAGVRMFLYGGSRTMPDGSNEIRALFTVVA